MLQQTLRSRVHDDFRDHAKNEVLAKAPGEAEAGPVMSILHDVQAVTVKVNLVVEVHLLERLQGNSVLSIVLGSVGLLLECEVVLDGTAGVLGLLVLSWRQGRNSDPEGT